MFRINLLPLLLGSLGSVGLCASALAADHIDGPRAIGDPPADITDIFAFPSPERPGHLVVIMNVNPFAGDDTRFSETLDYRFIIRRAVIVPGEETENKPGLSTDRELRIACNADEQVADNDDRSAKQRMICNGLGEEPVSAGLNDLTSDTTSSDRVRLFAGLRSDPFFLDGEALDEFTLSETMPEDMEEGINGLQDANVLSIVLELDPRPYLGSGTLFAIAAETLSRDRRSTRIDRMGRAEITNTLIAVAAHAGMEDHDTLKDLYNSESSFDVLEQNLGQYRNRIHANLFFYDRFDGELDWRLQPGRLPIVDMLLQDHLVVDIAKPCDDGSYLEIERAVLRGEPHRTCGGRQPNDDIFSMTNTLMVDGLSIDPESLIVVGVDEPTRWADAAWPYLEKPNSQHAETTVSVTLDASCDVVWTKIGEFTSLDEWYPGIARLDIGGKGIGATRSASLENGAQIIEQLQAVDRQARRYTYSMLSGPLPVVNYQASLKAQDAEEKIGCNVIWSAEFDADGAPKLPVIDAVNGIFQAGLNNLKAQFSGG